MKPNNKPKQKRTMKITLNRAEFAMMQYAFAKDPERETFTIETADYEEEEVCEYCKTKPCSCGEEETEEDRLRREAEDLMAELRGGS